MKEDIKLYVKNLPGWSTGRKIVVFISDDWGDLRIRNEEDYRNLIRIGIPVDKSIHTRYGALADKSDLHSLFEILSGVKDKNGRHAVFTPFIILTNPDYEKIKADNFEKYHYELFTDSIKKKENGHQTLEAWKEGIESGIFLPELHGREHFNVSQWLNLLKNGDKKLLQAFELHYSYLRTPLMKVSPVYAFYFSNNIEFQFLRESLSDAVRIFRTIFNREPLVFNPPNGMFHTAFYPQLAESGIKTINTKHFRMQPDRKGKIVRKYFRFGQISKEGIIHFISNCAFEPASESYNGVDITLRQVEIAFKCKKPALINTHRVNFIGSRERTIRDKSLSELSILLSKMKSRWPDLEFLSAGEFGSILRSGK
jgi:hypothetical protein